MCRLEGKIALVTGGARGIGASISRAFVKEGAKLVIADVLTDQGQALADELGKNAMFLELDVTDSSQWEATIAQIENTLGPITILVNNAGVRGNMKPITEVTQEEYQRIIDINQTSVFLGMRTVIPSMERAGGGSIVNTSSVYGLQGAAGQMDYCASKFAVTGLTKAGAIELAEKNIRVNSVHPGIIHTPMIDEAFAFWNLTEEEFTAPFPIKRFGQPQELADAFVFLASDAASFITGSSLSVDGGVSA